MFYLIKNKQMTNPHENLSLTAHNKNIEIWQFFLILVKFHLKKIDLKSTLLPLKLKM